MKAIFATLTLGWFVLAAPNPSAAMMSIGILSPAEAKELGVVVRTEPNGPNDLWVQLEFKAAGKLKDFSHVSLEIEDDHGFLFGWSALEAKRTASGVVTVGNFLIATRFLEKVTLRIVTGEPMNYAGLDVRLRDFVKLPGGGGQPAKPQPKAPSSPPSPPAPATGVKRD